MLLKELLKNVYDGALDAASGHREIFAVGSDSRTVEKDSLFVALKGSRQDGTDFIEEAIRRGARVIAASHVPSRQRSDVVFLRVADPRHFLREVTRRFYGPMASRVRCIGVTGTNGKTTITYLLESILKNAGKECGVIGTVNYRMAGEIFPSSSKNTTPGMVENQRFLAELFQRHIGYCVMEVSSHAIDQGRVALIDFQTAVFTNLTSDHLDYHGTRENYFLAKARLFTDLSSENTAVINLDDPWGQKLVAMTKAKVVRYGIREKADVCAADIELDVQGSRFNLCAPQGKAAIQTRLIGLHNVYNILAAAAAALAQGIGLDAVREGVARLEHVPGRLERIDSPKGFSVFIDYAHTEDALKNVLQALRGSVPGRIITVFGCGGDRDKTKRPKMGAVVGELSDAAIVTNDNPRGEDPQAIIQEIVAGFTKNNYEVIADREQAIRKAIETAQSGDIVLIAGKGHEDYQIFKDKTIAFDERGIVRKYLTC